MNELTKSIVDGWLGCITEADKARKSWESIADMCRAFYSEDCGFMWDDKFQNQYMARRQNKTLKPNIGVTVNKAFEFVSIYGPSLFWDYPNRQVVSPQRLEIYPDLFGPAQDEQVMEMFQELQGIDEEETRINKMRNSALQRWLNFTQREQPAGGLKMASELCVEDALLDGRGVMHVRSYRYPGSDRKMTGAFSVPPRDVFLDPDCADVTLRDCRWMAIRYREPCYVVEERFNLPKGSLYGKGTFETGDSKGRLNTPGHDNARNTKAFKFDDMIEWYEIYSKVGVGSKNPAARKEIDEMFDRAVGNYARICVAKNVPFILNCPDSMIETATIEEVRDAMDWPTPFWMDDSWPLIFLDFYRRNRRSAWPLPPLGPALGYLICINVLETVYLNKAWDNSQTIIAVAKSVMDDVKKRVESGDQTVYIEIVENSGKALKELVQILSRNGGGEEGLLRAIDSMENRFRECTGLTELMYGGGVNMSQSRSARDAEIKNEKVMVRAEHMGNKVAEWQSKIADAEKNCAFWELESSDVEPALGRVGSLIWDKLIADEDPEIIFRSTHAVVTASDIKRPDKARTLANINSMLGFMAPAIQDYANETGDREPMNALIKKVMNAADEDSEGLEMQSRQQQGPTPEQQVMEQLQAAKLEADVNRTNAEAQLKLVQAETAGQSQQGGQMEQLAMQMQLDVAKASQDMQINQAKAMQDMALKAQRAETDLAIARSKARQASRQGVAQNG